MDGGAWWATVHGVIKSQTRLSESLVKDPKTVICYNFKIVFGSNGILIIYIYTYIHIYQLSSDQIRSVAQSCPCHGESHGVALCDPMNRSTPGLPVHHHLPELTETHVHRVSDAIQPSHPLSSPSPLAPNPSQQQSLFQ